eukprot:767230-Hanusia_phi.AAC.6
MQDGDDTIKLMSMLRSMKRMNEYSRKAEHSSSRQTSGNDRWAHLLQEEPVCSEIFVEVSAIQEDGYVANSFRIEYDDLTNQILKMKVDNFSTNFQSMVLSICSGRHKRLGADSCFQTLDNHIVQYIVQVWMRDAFFFPEYAILDRSTIVNIELRTEFTFLNSVSKDITDEKFFSYNSLEESTLEMQMIEESCQFLNQENFSTVEVKNEARFERCLGLLVASKIKQRKGSIFWRWKFLCKAKQKQKKDTVIAGLHLLRGNMRRKIIFFSRWASWITALQKVQNEAHVRHEVSVEKDKEHVLQGTLDA